MYKKLLSVVALLFGAIYGWAQCPEITCPENISISNDEGSCGAVVNYSTPQGVDPCNSGSQTFNYSGSVQSFTAPKSTTYTLELWGAQGGNLTFGDGYTGGKGGYSTGEITLNEGDVVYVYVGGFPGSSTSYSDVSAESGGWNGGGNGSGGMSWPTVGGGGASDIRIGGQSLSDRIIVAGGGGGAGGPAGDGGYGGGTSGGAPTDTWGGQYADPGTQNSGFVLGQGGDGQSNRCGGGGGGYYGGFGGGHKGGNNPHDPGAGGSGYVGGVSSGQLIAGNTSMPDPAGGTMVGNSGHGVVKIFWEGAPVTTTQIAGLASGSEFPIGTTTNTFEAENEFGDVVTCSFTVTVIDDEAPVFSSCPTNIGGAPFIGNCEMSVSFPVPEFSDNCPGATMEQTAGLPSGSTFPVGTTTNTFVATDASGNTATCSFNVTIYDNQDPEIFNCPQDVSVSNDEGSCGAVVSFTSPSFSDNCSGASITQIAGLASGSEFPVGTTTNTFEVTDGSGNTASCSFTVTVADTEAPAFTACPENIATGNDEGNCDAAVSYEAPEFSDNCPGASISQIAGLASGSVFPVGTTTNTFVVTDLAGNTDTCSFTVTVNDVENPVFTVCPSNYGAAPLIGDCDFTVHYTSPEFADNCPGATMEQIEGLPSGSLFPQGVTTNVFEVTDAAGNTATCSFTVTVYDSQNPTITAPEDLSANADGGSCSASNVLLGEASSSDNCSVEEISNDAPAVFPVGQTTVTWTATDPSGNTSTDTQIVTVLDVQDPVISAPVGITVSADQGACYATELALGEPSVSDNCTVESVTNDAPASFQIGETTVTWTVTDGSGNTASATQIVLVEDNEAPSIEAPEMISLSADEGSCDATEAMLGEATASDNCSTESVTNDAPATFPLGETVVTWTVVDASGNEATDTQLVVVVDNQNPSISAPESLTISADEGSCQATQVDLGEASASDNCNVESVTNDAPESFPFGETVVTWTVTDASGNSATATQIVTVEDNENPSIVAPEPVTVSADEASCEASEVSLGEADATDNCLLAEVSNDAPEFFPTGETVVTWTATDAVGNTATATQIVTVVDEEVPTIIAPAAIEVNADSASCEATAVQLGEPQVADNCSINMISNNAPEAFTLGETDVVWTVIDESGNTTTAVQTVTVLDIEPPVLDTQELPEIVVDCAVMELEAPTATDLCAGQIEGQHDAQLPIMETSTITWTFEDGRGNTVTQTQDVVVTGIDVSVTATDTTLMANIEGATYQWIDCSDGSDLHRQYHRTFNPFEDGTYAVRITKDICTEVSDCYEVFATDISEVDIASQVSIYPNPNNGAFSITFSEQSKDVVVKVTDLRGRVISKKQFSEITKAEMQINEESGIYLVHIQSAKGSTVLRVVKNN